MSMTFDCSAAVSWRNAIDAMILWPVAFQARAGAAVMDQTSRHEMATRISCSRYLLLRLLFRSGNAHTIPSARDSIDLPHGRLNHEAVIRICLDHSSGGN